jgi:hypothetical protein
MAGRRRRGSNGTWIPVLPTQFEDGGDFVTWDTVSLQARFGTNGIGALLDIQAIGLVPDFTSEVSAQGPDTLRDLVEGQDWLCKRAVGKCWGGINFDPTGAFDDVILGVGIAVLPVSDQPVFQGSPALEEADYDPLLADNSAAPWFWRRTWRLSNPARFPPAAVPSAFTPGLGKFLIEDYGSVMDGGHIDAKGARRIAKEQRLFLVASARTLVETTSATLNTLFFNYDLRFFGAMRKAHNRSTFK